MHSIAIQKEDLFGQVRTFSQTIFNNLQLKDSKGLLNSDYMNLYNGISTFADKGPRKHGENLHEKGLFELFNAQLSSFFEGIFKSLNEKKGIAYLEEFVECSTNYSFYAGWLVRLFKYLDQFYMKRLSMDLTRVSFEKFKSTFLNNIQYELFAEVFNLLDNEREGFESNKTLILKVIKFYFMMCYDKDIKLEYDKDRNQFQFTGINQSNDFEFYKKEFETKLIENIKNYYLTKINTRWITETSSEFISQSLEALKREESMAIFYYPISKDKIREFLKKLLIEDFYEQVLDNPKSGLKEMLMNGADVSIENCYNLYIHVDYIIKGKISEIVKNYIDTKALKIVPVIPLQNLKSIKDIEECFREFINLKKNAEHILEKFKNFLEVEKAIDNAFFSFFANDASARYLAMYFDGVLREVQHTKADQESNLPLLIKIFRFVSSRDEFFETYKKKLITRILDEIVQSFDYEKDCLSKLKKECGVLLSTIMNCESILKDTEGISKTVTSSFQEHPSFKKCDVKFSFNFKILEKSSYSSGLKKMINFEMIPELQKIISAFQLFYKENNQNRLIEFIFQDGISEIEFNVNASKKYRMTIQNDVLPIFMMFNSQESVEKREMIIRSGISEKILEDRLNVCENRKILLKENDTYKVNKSFSHPRLNVEFNKMKPKIEGVREEEKKNAVDPERDEVKIRRQNILDATLVRIMKSRITMSYSDLMADCTKLVQNVFKPDVKMIRGRIESLMERGYMGRDESNATILKYIS